MVYDGLEVPQTEAAPNASPAAKVKAWLRQNLPPEKVQEFEQFMASLMDEGQDEEIEPGERQTGEGRGSGTRTRDRGDVGEDDQPGDVPNSRAMQAQGPTDARRRNAPISGYPGALDRRARLDISSPRALERSLRSNMAVDGALRDPARVADYLRHWPQAKSEGE
jgi:hypothetical protein